jgi:hemoglobin/transferrin/lactoferrin receptor protein
LEVSRALLRGKGIVSFNASSFMRIFFISLLILTTAPLFAQVVSVMSLETGDPIEQATVRDLSTGRYNTTDATGEADITYLGGSDGIEFRSVGYETQILSWKELGKANFLVFLEPTTFALDEVVISGTRWTQRKREVPAKVSTIRAKDIQLQNPQTAADLLGQSGEVFIQKSQQGGGSPMIRGFSTNRLLIAVDGIRMNTAIFRSGNLQNVISLDPFATQRAEVLFGPSSVIYGSDAIGGVMSFYTLDPKLAFEESPRVTGNAATRFASANNELGAHFDVNVGWRKWALLTSASFNRYGDLRMGRFGPDEYLRNFYVERIDSVDRVLDNPDPLVQRNTGFDQTHLMQKVRFQPNEYWTVDYGFHYSTTTNYDRYDRLLRTRNGLPRSAEWYYGPQDWMMNRLEVTHKAESGMYDQLDIRLAHQYFQESRIDRDFGDTERSRRVEEVDAYSLNVDFTKSVGRSHQVFYGVEGVLNQVRSEGTQEDIVTGKVSDGPDRYPQADWASYAAYLTWQWKPSPAWTIQAGGRYNQFQLNAEFDTTFYPFPFTEASINDGALTGALGVVWNPSRLWTLRFNGSTGFRAPNVDDVGKVFDSEPGAVVIPNPNLGAEYAYNAEVGMARRLGGVTLDATVFYTILENALVRRNFQLNGQDSIVYDGELSQVQAIQNAARANVWGVQAGITWKHSSGFRLGSQFNYQQGEEELDDGTISPSRHAAPWFGVTRIGYETDRLQLELNGMFSGEVAFEDLAFGERSKDFLYALDENGNPYAPAWYTLNFKVAYQINEQLNVSGGVENITDQRYRPYSSGLAGAGRNVLLSLRTVF